MKSEGFWKEEDFGKFLEGPKIAPHGTKGQNVCVSLGFSMVFGRTQDRFRRTPNHHRRHQGPGSVFYLGFLKVLHKTGVCGMGSMMNPLKTRVAHIMQEESH